MCALGIWFCLTLPTEQNAVNFPAVWIAPEVCCYRGKARAGLTPARAVALRLRWRGSSSTASWPSRPLNQFSSFLAKEPEWLHRNSLSANFGLSASCCAGDWIKHFDVVFSRTSMDLRGVMSSTTCWLLSGIFATWYLLLFLPTLHFCSVVCLRIGCILNQAFLDDQ